MMSVARFCAVTVLATSVMVSLCECSHAGLAITNEWRGTISISDEETYTDNDTDTITDTTTSFDGPGTLDVTIDRYGEMYMFFTPALFPYIPVGYATVGPDTIIGAVDANSPDSGTFASASLFVSNGSISPDGMVAGGYAVASATQFFSNRYIDGSGDEITVSDDNFASFQSSQSFQWTVPEPSSLVLAGSAAVLGLACAAKRKVAARHLDDLIDAR